MSERFWTAASWATGLIWIGAFLLIATLAFWPRDGACVWCPQFNCFNANMCGENCFCLYPPTSMSGKCFGSERAAPEGWTQPWGKGKDGE